MGKKKGQQHATHSFTQLVSKANQEALKPYIHAVFGELANDLSKRVFTRLGIFQNRIEALETVLKEKLNMTQHEIDTALFDLEDRVTGFQEVDDSTASKKGDLLRLTMRIKNTKTGYGKAIKKEFADLGNPPYAMGVPFLEEALIGLCRTAVKVVPFDPELKKATGTDEIEFTVDRVSELIPKIEAKKEESPNAESKDAAQSTGSPEAGQADPS